MTQRTQRAPSERLRLASEAMTAADELEKKLFGYTRMTSAASHELAHKLIEATRNLARYDRGVRIEVSA